MVRTQIQLTDEQARAIKRIASAKGVSVAEVIRRAVEGDHQVLLKGFVDCMVVQKALVIPFKEEGDGKITKKPCQMSGEFLPAGHRRFCNGRELIP